MTDELGTTGDGDEIRQAPTENAQPDINMVRVLGAGSIQLSMACIGGEGICRQEK